MSLADDLHPIRVCGAVVGIDGRYLMTDRPAGKSHAGFWEFPGGKNHSGESAAACLVRELREELDWDVMVLDMIFSVRHLYPGKLVDLSFHRCFPVAGAAPPRALEGQRLRWVTAAGMSEMNILPADRGLVSFLRMAGGFNR